MVGDLTIRHPCTVSNFPNTKRFCTKVAQDTLSKRSAVASPQVMDLATSRTLTNAEKTKRQTYGTLMKMVN